MEAPHALLTILGRNTNVLAFKRSVPINVLADNLGVSKAKVSRLLNGRTRYIDPAVLMKLTEIFECSYDELLQAHPDIDYFKEGVCVEA